jgi:septal ring factor EnvC (AmiA/AmiB activator)
MTLTPSSKNLHLFIASLVIVFACSSSSYAAEKDKSSRRTALMMQKMKQDMEAEKATMQTQFDAQKKELEDKLKSNDEELAKVNKMLIVAERKNKTLEGEIKKVTLAKEAIDAKQLQTQAQLETTQTNLDDLKTKYQQAQADLKFNDNQRKTLSTNLAQSAKSLDVCEAKNAKLHQFGTELIQIYDKPSSYEATMRKEQFFQLKRVELENILQDRQDQLNEELVVKKKAAY